MKQKLSALFLLAVVLFSCKDEHSDLPDGLYAEIETSKGTILLDLAFEKAPVTVANFVTLAEGKNKFVRDELKGRPFFNGLKWHRVIKDFMIQGGDPDGTGSGDTGYKFKDEITDLRHDRGGILSMANAGPATNSSQFFITHGATPWLDGLHTIFGHVVNYDIAVVNQINQGDIIKSVKIIRKGEKAKKFDAVKVFDNYFAEAAENLKKQDALDAESHREYETKYSEILSGQKAKLDELRKKSTKTPSGLEYIIVRNAYKPKPQYGTTVYVHYSGYLKNGELFDSSVAENAKSFGKYDESREEAGGYRPLGMQYGAKTGMIPGFLEGVSKLSIGDKAVFFIPPYLGYGEQGAGGVIPPNADLIFEVELLSSPE